MTASRLPVSAGLSVPARFPAIPAVLDMARGPFYTRRRGKDGISSRFRTPLEPSEEKEILILTKLEELVLIAVLKLKDGAYGISVYHAVAALTGKDVSLSSVYFPLERLARKGYLRTLKGESTPRRGGMSKRYYRVTKSGIRALQENRSLQEPAWKGVPEILQSGEEP